MSVKYQFDCGVDEVWALLCDPDFRVERGMSMGDVSADCEIEEDDGRVTVKMNREVIKELPSVLAKIFSPQQNLVITENWQAKGDGWEGSMVIEMKKQPIEMKATMSLKPTDSGCEYVVTHHCKAKIPLIGGKVEKFALGEADATAEEELQYLNEKVAV